MRIIKAAKQQDELIETCDNCTSILGIAKDDLRYDQDEQCYSARCPVCSKYIYYDTKDKESLFEWIMEDENEIPRDNSVRINSF